MNNVIMTGNLTHDIEGNAKAYGQTNNGRSFYNNSIAVNMGYYGQDGSWVDRAEFFNIRAYAGVADNLAKNYRKGEGILIQGEVRAEQYQDNGQNKVYHYILVSRVERSNRAKPQNTQGVAPQGAQSMAPTQTTTPTQTATPTQAAAPVQGVASQQVGAPIGGTGDDFNPFEEGLPFV